MSKSTGGPAFPATDENEINSTGMTLRDYLAAKAMAALLSNSNIAIVSLCSNRKWVTQAAYEYADAILQHRTDP